MSKTIEEQIFEIIALHIQEINKMTEEAKKRILELKARQKEKNNE